ncbi:B2 protein-like isoform X2 [Impatiens glandulifera]|uniref:B2 protein-like isoform X2 n=1 Tax=Impatiens glandulifera TaxID=253017 RepID=UPI001FB05693|nr:B2 protein-like isoform X2 [Impatiens glandulifera]
MESKYSLWQLGDDLRGQTKVVSDDHKWMDVASKLAEQTRIKGERRNNLDPSKGAEAARTWGNAGGFQEDNKFESFYFNMLNLESKMTENMNRSSLRSGMMNNQYMNVAYQKSMNITGGNLAESKYGMNSHYKEAKNSDYNNNNSDSTSTNVAVDKRFKTLPAAETLPRNEVLGLPPRYRDSVRAITPGLPLFLYNYTTHQLHGIFEAESFGGSNIDPMAWEDKKCKGESRFPAQVRIRIRKVCKALEEDSFRPVLHHYDGPKFRLELSVPETLDLLDLCEQAGGV